MSAVLHGLPWSCGVGFAAVVSVLQLQFRSVGVHESGLILLQVLVRLTSPVECDSVDRRPFHQRNTRQERTELTRQQWLNFHNKSVIVDKFELADHNHIHESDYLWMFSLDNCFIKCKSVVLAARLFSLSLWAACLFLRGQPVWDPAHHVGEDLCFEHCRRAAEESRGKKLGSCFSSSDLPSCDAAGSFSDSIKHYTDSHLWLLGRLTQPVMFLSFCF